MNNPSLPVAAEERLSYLRGLIGGLLYYDLPLRLVLLVLVLERDSDGRGRGQVRLVEWAAELGYADGKGLRVASLKGALGELKDLNVLDLDKTGGYSLRPHAPDWSHTPGLRGRRVADEAGQQKLGFSVDRPLSESLSDLSREKTRVGAGVAEGHAGSLYDYDRLRRAMDDPAEYALLQAEIAARGLAAPARDYSPGAARPVRAEKRVERGSVERPGLPGETDEAAMEWLRKKDLVGHLASDPEVYAQWWDLCERAPQFVLRDLRPRLQYYNDKNKREGLPAIADPLAWLSKRARELGKLRPLSRVLALAPGKGGAARSAENSAE